MTKDHEAASEVTAVGRIGLRRCAAAAAADTAVTTAAADTPWHPKKDCMRSGCCTTIR